MTSTLVHSRMLSLFLATAIPFLGWACAKQPHFERMAFTDDGGAPYKLRGQDAIVGGLAKGNGATSANVQIVLKRITAADNLEGAEVGFVASSASDLEQVGATIARVGGTIADIGMAGAALRTSQAALEGKLRDVATSTSLQTAPTAVSYSNQTQGQAQKQGQSQGQDQTGTLSNNTTASAAQSLTSTIQGGNVTGASSTSIAKGIGTGGTAINANDIDASPSVVNKTVSVSGASASPSP